MSTDGGSFRQGLPCGYDVDTASLVNHLLNPRLRGGEGVRAAAKDLTMIGLSNRHVRWDLTLIGLSNRRVRLALSRGERV
ncbi:hypothetical protein DIM_14070 [Candidatus Denitrolinea symbiosum]|nr:hypothetical protein DIM_14070 [Candidatus Denitrolinea symbiosum]